VPPGVQAVKRQSSPWTIRSLVFGSTKDTEPNNIDTSAYINASATTQTPSNEKYNDSSAIQLLSNPARHVPLEPVIPPAAPSSSSSLAETTTSPSQRKLKTAANIARLTVGMRAQLTKSQDDNYIKSRTLRPEFCEEQYLEADKLLDELNDVMKTNHQPESNPNIQNDLDCCIKRGLDFGTIFGLLRTRWEFECEECGDRSYQGWHRTRPVSRNGNGELCTCILCTYGLAAATVPPHSISRPALAGERTIDDPYEKMPRRMWDLLSDRVIPFEATIKPRCRGVNCRKSRPMPAGATQIPDFIAISHSWTDDMNPVQSYLNQQQWDIPLPASILLEDVRLYVQKIARRETGRHVQYCWLDVLCLRQYSDS